MREDVEEVREGRVGWNSSVLRLQGRHPRPSNGVLLNCR